MEEKFDVVHVQGTEQGPGHAETWQEILRILSAL
jgi:hypothetical protein